MADPTLGLAFGAGSSALGGILSFIGGQSANAANLAFQQQQAQTQYNLAQYQIANNNWLAENGISIRVNDARNAGISPLVALGAPTFNPGPVQNVDMGGPTQSNAMSGMGSALGGMGQDISRAAMAAQSDAVRIQGLKDLETMRNSSVVAQSEAQKNMADAALANKKADILGQPGLWGAGTGVPPAGMVKPVPSSQVSASPGQAGSEAATTPTGQWVTNADGSRTLQPSLHTSEGATGASAMWRFQNMTTPPPGGDWHQRFDGSWVQGPQGPQYMDYWRNLAKSRIPIPDYSGVPDVTRMAP